LNFKATPRNFSSAVALQVRSGIVLIRTTETQPDLAIFQSVDILDKGAQSVGISAFHHATTWWTTETILETLFEGKKEIFLIHVLLIKQ